MINPICDYCKNELEDFGAILLSPPNKLIVKKFHVCLTCYEKIKPKDNMKYFKFIKEDDNKWYVDLPSWEGHKEELEMVLGADTMLDLLDLNQLHKVSLSIDTSHVNDSLIELHHLYDESGGAWYELKSKYYTSFNIWLCSVVKFVYGEIPRKFYINKIENSL